MLEEESLQITVVIVIAVQNGYLYYYIKVSGGFNVSDWGELWNSENTYTK